MTKHPAPIGAALFAPAFAAAKTAMRLAEPQPPFRIEMGEWSGRMIPGGGSPVWEEAWLSDRLEAFVHEREAGPPALPWSDRLSPRDRERLRTDLELVLSEPELTGEPVDWREIEAILGEWAEAAGWKGALIQPDRMPRDGRYAVDLPSRDAEALVTASVAVQSAMQTLLTEFLPSHPTAGHLLPRGRLKKMKNRDVWQIELPDGYRLRYFVDKRERTVQILYLGPHPDRDTEGREQAARARMQRGRNGSG